jgi:Putative peptidoglycan binding domain
MKTMSWAALLIAVLIALTPPEATGRGRHGGGGGGGFGVSAPRGHAGGAARFGGARFSGGGARFSGAGPRFSRSGARFAGGTLRYTPSARRFSSPGFRSSSAISPQNRIRSSRAVIDRAIGRSETDQDRFATSRPNQRTIASRAPSRDRLSGRVSDRRSLRYARRPADWHRNWDRRRHHYWNGRWWRYDNGYWIGFYGGYYPYWYSYYPYNYFGYGYYPYSYPYDYYAGEIYTSADQYSDSTVSAAQAELVSRGYYRGAIDGIVGPQTRDAIGRYQRDHGLTVSGVLTADTLQSLGLG